MDISFVNLRAWKRRAVPTADFIRRRRTGLTALALSSSVLTPLVVAAQPEPPVPPAQVAPSTAATGARTGTGEVRQLDLSLPRQVADVRTSQVMIESRIAIVTTSVSAELLAGVKWDNIAEVIAGTATSPSGDHAAIKSDSTLSGVGVGLHVRYQLERDFIDLTSAPAANSARTFPFVDFNFRYGNTTGKAHGSVDGDGFLTHIQPIKGIPGGAVPYYNATISSRLTSYQVDATYNMALRVSPVIDESSMNITLGVGINYKHLNTQHSATLTLPNGIPFDKRDISTSDNYIGPLIKLDLSTARGPWQFAAGAYISPTFRWTGASIFEDFDGLYSTRICDSDTGFSFNTGVYGKIGYSITDNIRIFTGANFNYHSAVSSWQIPVSPSDQPARLKRSSSWSAGINFGLEFRF